MPRTPAQSLRRTAVRTGVSLAVVASARVLFKPLPRTETAPVVDWERVRRSAHARTGEKGPLLNDPAQAAQYDAIARSLAPTMAPVLGSELQTFPGFRALDRRGFVNLNVTIAGRLVQPLEELRGTMAESRAGIMSRAVLSRYIGELMGFLSTRAMGQYDPVLQLSPQMVEGAEPTALFLVEPNLDGFARDAQIPGLALRRWIILHELTHAWQFESHPWLPEHLAQTMRELMLSGLLRDGGNGDDGGAGLVSSRELVQHMPTTLRTQLRSAARIQAVMSVLEGYSDFVMHRVGADQIEGYTTLEKAFATRRRQRTMLEKIVMAVTGIRIKMRQYEAGKRFADMIADEAGITTLNRVWDGPEMMPSSAELNDPALWLRRVG